LNTLSARAEGFAVESESYFTLSAATDQEQTMEFQLEVDYFLSLENLIMLF
jgi:hypothetical protein